MDTDDELDDLSNLCTDLVSLKRFEPALVHLFRERPSGAWVSVAELYQFAGVEAVVPSSLQVAWLPAASGSGYSAVTFFDDEQAWSLSAAYHTARLLNPARTAAA
jgi:hypothetical protein